MGLVLVFSGGVSPSPAMRGADCDRLLEGGMLLTTFSLQNRLYVVEPLRGSS